MPETAHFPFITACEKILKMLDHCVAALGNDPSCALRRVLVYVDIDRHPETSQNMMVARLGIDKHSLNRDIIWLRDHGCIRRDFGEQDARLFHIVTHGYGRKNIHLALQLYGSSHAAMTDFFSAFIQLFGSCKPTLRDARLLILIARRGSMTRRELFRQGYTCPATTNNRALNLLVRQDLIVKVEDALPDRYCISDPVITELTSLVMSVSSVSRVG